MNENFKRIRLALIKDRAVRYRRAKLLQHNMAVLAAAFAAVATIGPSAGPRST